MAAGDDAGHRKWVIGGDVNGSGGVEAAFTGSVALARLYSEPLSHLDILRLSKRELSANDTLGPLTRLSEQPADTGTVGQAYGVPAFAAVDDSGVVAKATVQVEVYTATDKAGNVTESSFSIDVQ